MQILDFQLILNLVTIAFFEKCCYVQLFAKVTIPIFDAHHAHRIVITLVEKTLHTC